ncbi:hypothetical protein [Luedemannella helvata]|uniref:Uncharacterized protein n=1 Tax=Luedemannella helvata TaxID=349315 RepID=A0ABP4W9S3_9ACTN
MFKRKATVKSHSDMFRDEIAESYDHFKAAASHAPGGAAEMLTPAYDKTRHMASRRMKQGVAVIVPLYATMKSGVRHARSTPEPKKERNALPALLVLLTAGVALGALGALVMRRRRAAQEWDEFEPSGSFEDETVEVRSKVSTATKKMTEGAASVAGNVSDRAGRLADSLRGKSGEAEDRPHGESPFKAFADDNPTADDLVARAGNQEQNP